ncbi:MAG: D-isomer specific 2-hydroxyacid dehydrogenase family protein [Egibacteraceae bacterium]
MASARIAVLPEETRAYIRSAVTAGGGELVAPDAAEALVWTAPDDPEGLQELLDANPHLRWVQLPWAGVEPYARAGVFGGERLWTSGKGVYSEPVAEHAMALALAGLREIGRFAQARSWGEEAGISLMRGKATIFGGGGITTKLIELLRPFGAEITVVRNHPRPMDGVHRVLEFERRYEALTGADVVFLALALTPQTRRFITAVELEVMEPHAWLVNVARGQHVDTEDLMVALRGDVIGGAALDVTEPEPLPEGHPLWALPNCIITPHVGNTDDMQQPLLSARISENVRRFAQDEELIGLVDPDLGY